MPRAAASETFTGVYRAAVKTAVWRTPDGQVAPFEPVGTLDALVAMVPTDAKMREMYPEIEVAARAPAADKAKAPSTRFPEEQHNVAVRGYLWCAKREGDNDFHVIIGSTNTGGPGTVFLNVEASALPAGGGPDIATLTAARNQLRAILGEEPSNVNYTYPKQPILVRVTGSLLFDGDHVAGLPDSPGPAMQKPQTTWEIHPVVSFDDLTTGLSPAGRPSAAAPGSAHRGRVLKPRPGATTAGRTRAPAKRPVKKAAAPRRRRPAGG